jgi:hypothetical protein
MAQHRGNGDAAGLNGQYLCHFYISETALKLLRNLAITSMSI